MSTITKGGRERHGLLHLGLQSYSYHTSDKKLKPHSIAKEKRQLLSIEQRKHVMSTISTLILLLHKSRHHLPTFFLTKDTSHLQNHSYKEGCNNMQFTRRTS